jgi:hypothetical protein
MPIGCNGFRVFFAPRNELPHFVVCKCGWRPDFGKHYAWKKHAERYDTLRKRTKRERESGPSRKAAFNSSASTWKRNERRTNARENGPLHGMRFKLERKADKRQPCCSDFAIIRVREGAAELRCAACGHPRGELHKEAMEWILNVLAHWPEAAKDVHVLRDPLAARRRDAKERENMTVQGAESD